MSFRARHNVDTGNPCVCRACNEMPPAWRDELREDYTRRLADRAYSNKNALRWGKAVDTTPLEPATLDHYTSLGSYPLVYVSSEGDTYCGTCMLKELRAGNVRHPEGCSYGAHYEGPPDACCECGEEIESAYGDPNASEDEDADDDETEATLVHDVNAHD